jgi:hypothetical protein
MATICSVLVVMFVGRFSEPSYQTIDPSNSTAGQSSFGGDGKQLFTVLASKSTIVNISAHYDGDPIADDTHVRYSIDLQPPLGPNTYIGAVTVTYVFEGAGDVQFGLRREHAKNSSCCSNLKDFCDGLYSKRINSSTTMLAAPQTFTMDRSSVGYVTRTNASRGISFTKSIMSPGTCCLTSCHLSGADI